MQRRRRSPRPSSALLLSLLSSSSLHTQSNAFTSSSHLLSSKQSCSTTTSLHMFDFIKKAQESTAESIKKAQESFAESTNAIATGLAKSRNALLYNLEDALAGESGNLMDNLEDTLLQADLGMATTDDVLEEARILREGTDIFGRNDVKALLRGKLLEALGATTTVTEDSTEQENKFALRFATPQNGIPAKDTNNRSIDKPLTVHFIMGANGMGKTTTIGKLAHRMRTEGQQKVLLAACDTFRAGAVAQLELWGERAQVDCFSPNENTNGPSAVLYGALDKAIKEEYDVLLVDTSGRLSNNDALTRELEKMKRVIQKRMAVEYKTDEEGGGSRPVPNLETPHETLLVIDAAQGRMALDSAKQWDKEVGLTGLILTKLDGSAKGGSVVAVSRELGLPVKLVGVGEGMEDLRDVSLFVLLVCFLFVACATLCLLCIFSHVTLLTNCTV
jgi:fused signal recognition particle receptor